MVLSGSVVFVGAQVNVSIMDLSGVLSDKDSDGVADSITFFFPPMWNIPDNVANTDDQIILEVLTVAANVPSPTFNRGENSRITMDYLAPFKTNLVALTLTYPTFIITKTATRPSYPESGTVITYTVTINNRSPSAPAYNVTIRDLLSGNLRLVPESLTTSVGQIVTGNGEGNSTIEISHPRLLVGETVVVTYNAILTNVVNASAVVENTAGVEYLSAIPASYNTVQNRKDTLYKSAEVNIATPEVYVSVANTSFGEALSTYAIGQVTRLLVSFVIPQGTTANARLLVQLPNTTVGLVQVVSSAIVSFPQNINSSAGLVNGSLAVVTDSNGDGYTDLCTYNFGNLLNIPDGAQQNANDTIVVEVYGVLINHDFNVRSDALSTRATLNYHTGAKEASMPKLLSATVVEPVLSTAQVVSSSASYLEAGVIVDYTVTISQVSATNKYTAFDLVITDAMTPYTSLIVGSVVPTLGTVVKGNNANDTTVHVALSSLSTTSNLVIRYSALVLNNAQPGARITSTAEFTCYSIPLSFSGNNTRSYPKPASTYFDMTTISTVLSINSSSIPETSTYLTAIGEVVTFTSTSTIPQGTTNNAVFSIRAPQVCPSGVTQCSSTGRMHFVARPSITFMASNFNSSTGLAVGSLATSLLDVNNDGYMDTAVFDFGNLLNAPDGLVAGLNDKIVVTGAVLAVDQTVNYNNVQTYMYANFSYTGLAVQKNAYDNFLIQFVEPHVYLTHSVSDLAYVQVGEIQTYIINVIHYSSDSTGPAYNSTVNNTMNPQLRLVPGSVVITGGKGGVVLSGNTSDDTVHLVVSLNAFVRADSSVVISYKAIIQNGTLSSSTVPSTALMEYWSAPTDQYNTNNRRPYYTSVGKNFIVADPSMTLSLNSTSISESGGTVVAVGEVIRVTAILMFPQATTADVSFSFMSTPSFPGYLSIVNASIIEMASNVISARGLARGSVITPEDTNADGIFDWAYFNFGNIVNIQEGATKAVTDIIMLEINMVVSETYNYHGLPLSALGTFAYTNGNKYIESTLSVSVTVASPVLNIVKSSSIPSKYLEAGSSVLYTIIITPIIPNAPVFQGVLTDLLGPRFELQNDTLTSTHGTFMNYTKGGDLTIRVPDGFSSGSVMKVTYNATLTTEVYAATQVDNTASLFFYSAPNAVIGNQRSWTIQSTTAIAAASPVLSIGLSSSSLPQVLPHDVVIGATIKFLASVVVPQGSTGNVVFNITLPATTGGKFKALSSTIVKMASNFNSSTMLKEGYSGILVDSNNDNIADRATYSFGTLVNTPDFVSQGSFLSSPQSN